MQSLLVSQYEKYIILLQYQQFHSWFIVSFSGKSVQLNNSIKLQVTCTIFYIQLDLNN